jgi:hypothetical protein
MLPKPIQASYALPNERGADDDDTCGVHKGE